MAYVDLLKEKRENGVLVVSHRGSSSGNVPCNTIPAFNAALLEGADIVELDVSVSREGKLYVFHPGMEHPHIGTRKLIALRKSASVEKLRFLNQDNVKTSYGVDTLENVLTFLKGKCFINIDKFWTAPGKITECIKKCGVESQVIIKTNCSEKDFKNVEKYAPDLMFMPVIKDNDTVIDKLKKMNVNLIGAEICFEDENAQVVSKEFFERMHGDGLLLWGNAIVYNEKDVISAHHTDDSAVAGDREKGWGWFVDRGFDIIQTDRAGLLKNYLLNR